MTDPSCYLCKPQGSVELVKRPGSAFGGPWTEFRPYVCPKCREQHLEPAK